MPKLDIKIKDFVRFRGGYIPPTNYGSDFKESFFPHTSDLWKNIPKHIQCKDLTEFKECTKIEIFNFLGGISSVLSNSLLTKIRVGRSDLNQHKLTIGLCESPQCLWHVKPK